MTVATGTGSTNPLVLKTEYFDDLSSADFDFEGVLGYLNWNFTLFVNHVTLLHADYVNNGNLLVYLHWDFELPTWNSEHSVEVTDVLMKYWVNYHTLS